jgi:polyphosphate glucokinase
LLLVVSSVKVLVIDIGGSHVKLQVSGAREPRHFDSTSNLGPHAFVARALEAASDWSFDVVSIGYPGVIGKDGPVGEPGNLGDGWVGFDFESAFGRPVRLVNDAALQALGAYTGGRMLFIGLGTGVGSAIVADRVVIPLELGCLWCSEGATLAERLGKAGLDEYGGEAWQRTLRDSIDMMKRAFEPDYIVLGGGNASLVDPMPEGTVRGGNEDAVTGGFRLWEERVEPHDRPASRAWRILR